MPLKSTGSCGIIDSLLRRSARPMSQMLIPSILMEPPQGSTRRNRTTPREDLPAQRGRGHVSILRRRKQHRHQLPYYFRIFPLLYLHLGDTCIQQLCCYYTKHSVCEPFKLQCTVDMTALDGGLDEEEVFHTELDSPDPVRPTIPTFSLGRMVQEIFFRTSGRFSR